MGLFGRNKKEDESVQAVPMTPPQSNKTSGNKGGSGGGLRQWLIDSYNGLYKVVLQPSMPTKQTIILLVIGLLIGLVWGYLLSPTVFYGANPNRLNDAAQAQWIRMVAVGAYSRSEYTEQSAAELASKVPNPIQTINTLLGDPNLSQSDRDSLQYLLSILPPDLAGSEPIVPPAALNQLSGLLVPFLLIIIVTPILVLIWRLLIYPNIGAAIVTKVRETRDPELAEKNRRSRDELKVMQQQRVLRDQMKAEVSTDVELGEPVMQYLAIYKPERNFDESVEIELPLDKGGDFLGQCGTVIAEAVDPDPVAVEVWLFDMFSQENLKKIFVTDAGYRDDTIRRRLEADVDNPATDVVVAIPGAAVNLDTEKLRLQGKLSSVSVNENGRFQDFNLQLRAWQKTGAVRPAAPAGLPPIPAAKPLPDYGNIEFEPPPAMPQPAAPSFPAQPPGFAPLPPQQPSAPSGFQPLTPPPLSQPQAPRPGLTPLTPPPLRPQPPVSSDDDPFGGTGDFTPLPRD